MNAEAKARLLNRVSARLVELLEVADRQFQEWRETRCRRCLPNKSSEAYVRTVRRCHLLKRAERRLA